MQPLRALTHPPNYCWRINKVPCHPSILYYSPLDANSIGVFTYLGTQGLFLCTHYRGFGVFLITPHYQKSFLLQPRKIRNLPIPIHNGHTISASVPQSSSQELRGKKRLLVGFMLSKESTARCSPGLFFAQLQYYTRRVTGRVINQLAIEIRFLISSC